MGQILNIIIFLISLGILITIHELGHFIAAKAFKVYVKEFSLGFGPMLFKIKKGETQYSIRALPLGGYVLMVGEEVAADPELSELPKERTLIGIAKWKRAVIMSAGIILNFILAYVLFFVSSAAFEQRQLTNRMTIAEGSPAASSLILTDEVLDFTYLEETVIPVTVNGTDTYYLKYIGFTGYEQDLVEVVEFSKSEAGETIVYAPTNGTDTITFQVQVRHYTSEEEFTTRLVGISLSTKEAEGKFEIEKTGMSFQTLSFRYTFAEALEKGGEDWWNGFTLIARSLGDIFSGRNLNQVGGIVAIFETSSDVLENLGLGIYIYLWGLISVNLAMFNLLPFPGLDGWHLFVIIVEGITRKEIPSKAKNIISGIGFILLMVLMMFLLVKDLFLISLL